MDAARAPSPRPQISVIIAHLNQSHALEQCLRALANNTRKADQVIIVDNGSHDPIDTIVSTYPGAVLLAEAEPGPGPARNKGAEYASGDVLAFIDADCIASESWLESAEKVLSDPDISIIGGDVRIAVVSPQSLTMIEAYESVYAYRMDRYIAEQSFTGTGNLVVRRSVWDDVGPFAGLSVAEDRDWGRRATAKGYSIKYAEDMRVYHPARPDFKSLFAKWDRQLGHDYHHAQAQGWRGSIVWFIKMWALGVSPLIEIPRIITCERIKGPRARLLALMGLTIVRFYRAKTMAKLLFFGHHEGLSNRWNRQ